MKKFIIFSICAVFCKNILCAADTREFAFPYYSEMFSVLLKSINNDFKKFQKNIKPAYVVQKYKQLNTFDYILLFRNINNNSLPLSRETQNNIIQAFISLKHHKKLDDFDKAKEVWDKICVNMKIYQVSSDRIAFLLKKLYSDQE